jgi:hypothetical protein
VSAFPSRYGDARDRSVDAVPLGTPSPRDVPLLGDPSPRRTLGERSGDGGGSPRDVSSPRDALPTDVGERQTFLRSLDREARLIAWACGRAEAPSGVEFHCVLPAHAVDGVARVEVGPTRVAYMCDCDDDRPAFERSMTEVYSTRLAGPRKLGRPEYLRWKVRLAVESGVLIAPIVKLPPLPENATDYAVRVYSGLRVFVAVRTLTDKPGEPFTFARAFVAEWCGLTREEANAGIKSLVRANVLVKVGTVPVGAHEANLYLVGTGASDVKTTGDDTR